MSANYPPRTDKQIFDFGVNLSTQLGNLDPSTIGLTEAQVTAWIGAIDAFNILYNDCKSTTLRSPSKLEAKRLAKIEWFRVTREMVNIVQSYPGTTDLMRRDLDINVRDTSYSPIPKPDSSPVLTVTNVAGRVLSLTLRERMPDGEAAEHRRKPEGVKGAAVYYVLGEPVPSNPQDWTFVGNVSRTNVTVTMPVDVAPGTVVHLTAQWFNPRLVTGPACEPVKTIVNFGGDLQMAA